MAVRVDLLNPGSERDLADAAALITAYWREVLGPDEPPTLPSEVLDSLHVERDDIDSARLLARVDGDAVGIASCDIRSGMGNEHMVWVEDFFVLPHRRRQGIGTLLLHELVDRARAAGRTLLLGGYDEGNVDGAAFAEHVGATTSNTEVQNRAATAGWDRAMLEQWVADAAVGAAGYSLVAYDSRCPDDLLDALVEVKKAMNDAPRTEKLDDFKHTAEHVRASEAEAVAAGTVMWFVGARHDATGELGGYSQLYWNPRKPWLADQGDTAVIAAHRGHGIGRWLKAVNALRLLDERPDVRIVETWNDGSNKWMLAINDAMGFRPAARWIETELELS
jgi:GNAT superfamily N-acetyltransferase